jgi:hypothetical protein
MPCLYVLLRILIRTKKSAKGCEMMEGFYFVIPISGFNRTNTRKDEEDNGYFKLI